MIWNFISTVIGNVIGLTCLGLIERFWAFEYILQILTWPPFLSQTTQNEEAGEMNDLAQVGGAQLLSNWVFPDEHEARPSPAARDGAMMEPPSWSRIIRLIRVEL